MDATMNRPDQNDVLILELDRPREIRLSHRALKRFSALTKCSVADMEQEIQHYDQLTCLLWVMVTDEQFDRKEEIMTPDDLDVLLNKSKYKISDLMKICSQAIKAAFEDEEGEEESDETDPPQTAAGTGHEA